MVEVVEVAVAVVEVAVAVVEVEEAEVVALCSPDQGQGLPHHHPLHLLGDQAVGDYQDLVLLDLQVQNLPLHLLEDFARYFVDYIKNFVYIKLLFCYFSFT